MAGNRTLKLSILADTDDLVKGLKKAENETGNSGNRIGDTFKKVGAAAAAAGIAAAAFAIKLGIDATKAASDFSETLAKTNVLFGQSSVAVQKFADTAAAQFGQSKQQALDASATFATFGRAAGLAGEELVTFSTDFVGLASDLASFNNTTPEQAINAIGSALRGEAEPLRQFGVLLDDATLRNAALELGLISTTKNALTPQQKVLAAQKVIYEQTSAAQGDFARTSDGLANQQRILTAELENTKIEIGEQLLPVAVDLFRFFNESLVPIINIHLVPAFQKTFDRITDLWKTIKINLSPLVVDLGRIFETTKRIVEVFNFETKKGEENINFLNASLQATRFIVENFVLKPLEAVLRLYEILFNLIKAIAYFMQYDFKNAHLSLKDAIDAVTGSLDKETSALKRNADAAADRYRQFQELSKTPTGGGGAILPPFIPSGGMTGPSTGSATVPTIRGLSTSQIQTLRDDLGLISQFGGVIEGLNEKFGDPFFGFGKGFNVSESIRTGIPVTNRNPRTTPTVNVNVTGNLIDPAGAARAIAEIIRNEGSRNGNLPLVSEFIAQ